MKQYVYVCNYLVIGIFVPRQFQNAIHSYTAVVDLLHMHWLGLHYLCMIKNEQVDKFANTRHSKRPNLKPFHIYFDMFK